MKEKPSNPLSPENPLPYISIIGWIVLICDLVVTLGLWHFVNNNANSEAQGRFQFRSHEIEVAIKERLVTYEQVLMGGIGLFESTHLKVDRDMFKTYVDNLNIEEHYRGIQGIGFSKPISPQDKDKHIQEVRESGFPDYTINPQSKREQYTSIIYLEPFSGRNLRAFGYDMFSEPVRRKAMERARDTGKPSLTGKVILVQETEKDIQTGFLMYLPVYKRNMPLDTIEERRAALFGYVYSPFRTRDFLEGVLGQRKIPEMAFELFDGIVLAQEALLYNSNPDHNVVSSIFQENLKIKFHDHVWSLELSSLKPFENTIQKENSIAVLIIGLLVSLVFFTVLWLTHTARNKTVKYARKLNDSLIESENRFKNVLYHSPAIIFIKDLEGRYTFSNRALEKVTGISKESMVGKTTQEIFPKHIADQFDANDKKLMETLTPQVLEEVVPQKGGPPLNYLSTQFPLFDSDKKPYAICGISTDITQRIQAEQSLLKYQDELEEQVSIRTRQIQKTLIELRKSEERLKLTFEATSEGIWDWNIKTGEVFFSSQWFQSLGYEPNELPRHVDTWKNLVHPEDIPEVMEKLNAHLEGKTEVYECENRLKTKSGSWRWNLDRGKVVARDADGHPIRMVGTDADITQRKKIETDLKVREGDFAQAQEMAHLGSWVWDIPENKLYWSDEVYRIFGVPPQEVKPTYELFIDTVHPEDRSFVRQANRDSIFGRQYFDIKHRIVTGNGEVKHVHQKSQTLYNHEGYPIKVVGFVHDITKIKTAEDNLLINREKFRLLYNQISQVLEGTSSATSGENFFQSLVYHLASTLGFSFALIGQINKVDKSLCRTLAYCIDGENVSNVEYALPGTPCEQIFEGATVFYSDNLQKEFPSDEYIKEYGLKCYFGVPIFGQDGSTVAHLAVMDTKPRAYTPEILSILSLFAARAESEMIRLDIQKELEVSQERLRKLNKKVQSVREEEKLHLAREIHDELGQVISYCKLDLLWLQKEIDNPEDKIAKKLDSVVFHLDDALNRVRRIASELRPEILDVLGISEAMKWQTQKFMDQIHIECELNITPEKIQCDRDQSIDLFRIFQETLTNISRHAHATSVQIKFTQEKKYYSLLVTDNGKGFDTTLTSHPQSLGILGMKERSLNWGGQVNIQSKLGLGTTVSVMIPIKDNNDINASK